MTQIFKNNILEMSKGFSFLFSLSDPSEQQKEPFLLFLNNTTLGLRARIVWFACILKS